MKKGMEYWTNVNELSIMDIIGLRAVAVKGIRDVDSKEKKQSIFPEYIFFDDGETYMELEKQDYYTYHDCASCARIIHVYKGKQHYNNLFNSPDLIDSNTDF